MLNLHKQGDRWAFTCTIVVKFGSMYSLQVKLRLVIKTFCCCCCICIYTTGLKALHDPSNCIRTAQAVKLLTFP